MSVRRLVAGTALLLISSAAMAADYNCYSDYRRLNRMNPHTRQYAWLYEQYQNRCAGQEREPHQQQRRQVYGACYELRKACLHKDQLGEQGAGNCARYRQECRGQ
jgi:hypothetical protein